MMNFYVFVYGTLRSGQPNAYLLKEAKLKLQNAWTYGSLYSTEQYYPILIHSSKDKVYGDVYEVTSTQLGLLDELEGYYGANKSNLYNRYIQSIYTEEEEIMAWVYTIHPSNECMKREQIINGDWSTYNCSP